MPTFPCDPTFLHTTGCPLVGNTLFGIRMPLKYPNHVDPYAVILDTLCSGGAHAKAPTKTEGSRSMAMEALFDCVLQGLFSESPLIISLSEMLLKVMVGTLFFIFFSILYYLKLV